MVQNIQQTFNYKYKHLSCIKQKYKNSTYRKYICYSCSYCCNAFYKMDRYTYNKLNAYTSVCKCKKYIKKFKKLSFNNHSDITYIRYFRSYPLLLYGYISICYYGFNFFNFLLLDTSNKKN